MNPETKEKLARLLRYVSIGAECSDAGWEACKRPWIESADTFIARLEQVGLKLEPL